jgi:hypothetical protein
MIKRNSLSLGMQVRIAEAMKPLLAGPDANGYWSYIPPHNDASIAATFSTPETPVTDTNVAHIRKELFGGIRSGGSPLRRTASRVDAVEAEVRELRSLLDLAISDHAKFAAGVAKTLADLTARVERIALVKR